MLSLVMVTLMRTRPGSVLTFSRSAVSWALRRIIWPSLYADIFSSLVVCDCVTPVLSDSVMLKRKVVVVSMMISFVCTSVSPAARDRPLNTSPSRASVTLMPV